MSTEQKRAFNLSCKDLASLFVMLVYQKESSRFEELTYRQKSSAGYQVLSFPSLHVSVSSFKLTLSFQRFLATEEISLGFTAWNSS